nr:glycosyltransferase [uncultured Amphritea sp.]
MNKGILLYDYLFAKGGAEKLSLSFLKKNEGTDFCVAFKDKELFPDGDTCTGDEYVLSSYSSLKGWKTLKTMFSFLFKKVFYKDYEWAMYSGEYAPLAILRNKSRAKKNILYCHTIPRAPYDLKDFKLSQLGFLEKQLFKVIIWLIKVLYEPSIKRMDVVIANSINVKKRIKKHLNIDAIVVNPPIDTENFKWKGQSDFYLSTARLEPAKRVEIIVRAFMEMPEKNLLIASGGSQLEYLRDLASSHKNIKFMGWCSDNDMHEAVGTCIATIYIPVDEDFGMSPVESMAAGKPVIGVAEGGLLETVISGETGVLIESPTKNEIIKVVNDMTKEKCIGMRLKCESQAANYKEDRFISEIRSVISSI